MEWLKKLLGEEKYNSIPKETLELLKNGLGDTEYIANDPLKIIPKSVFNEKNEEAKLLKEQIKQYEKQLEQTSGMITSNDMKIKLEEQKQAFANQLKVMQENFDNEKLNMQKEAILLSELQKNGCLYPDLMIKNIKFDDVILKDGKILNSNDLVTPLKETYKNLFEIKLGTQNNMFKGGQQQTQVPSTKAELIEKYNKAMESNNLVDAMSLQRQIKQINESE